MRKQDLLTSIWDFPGGAEKSEFNTDSLSFK